MLILIALLLDLVLIPAFWPAKPVRIHAYTVLAAVNVMFYLLSMIFFFRRVRLDENRHGFIFRFVVLQFFLLTALILYKLTGLLILDSCL